MADFESLWKAAQQGELLLLDGGFCHWHLRRDGQLTIYEIISLKPGMGTRMLDILKETKGVLSIVARCPADLESNAWYKKKGFKLEKVEEARTGRKLNKWRLTIRIPGFGL